MTSSLASKGQIPLIPRWTWWPLPRRYLVSILGFFGFIHIYLLRVNMSFAIVAMTKNHPVILENGTTTYSADFDWNSKERGVILSSFFYGYITTQILGGILAPFVGGGRLTCLAIFGTAVLTLATPSVAYAGGQIPLMVLRIFQGIFQGVIFPSMFDLFSYWTPPLERTKLLGITYSGNHMGTFITMALCGIISEYLGWPWIFYIFGTTGILWCALWTWKVYENPNLDPNISPEEWEYITTSIGQVNRVKFTEAPWRSILTSVPVWALFTAHTVQNSGFYTMLTQLPTFLNDVSGWRLDQMGLLAALPYLAMAFVVLSSGHLADLLRTRFTIPTTIVRKVFTSGCYIIQMSFLLVTAQMTHSAPLALTCLVIAVSSGGFAAYSVNSLDLAPQYSSILIGLSNTFATLPGLISPTVTGYIVQNKLASEWLTVFYITSGVYLFGAIFYAVFASGEMQPWAAPPNTTELIQEMDEENKSLKDEEVGVISIKK